MSIRSALVDEGASLVSALGALSLAELGRPTRCQPWDVTTLAAHVLRGAERVGEVIQTAGQNDPDPDPFVYYRSPRRSDPARQEVRNQGAAHTATRFSSGHQLAEAVDGAVAVTVDSLDRLGGDIAVTTHWGPVLRFEDYLLTRVVELGVHGLDVADAIGRTTWLTATAGGEIAALLRALLPPGALKIDAWEDELLIRIGTGRATDQVDERLVPESAAKLLPLIS